MSYPINYPTPTNADVQIFVGTGSGVTTAARTRTWVKPQGSSFVWFTLIGGGGVADVSSSSGGGSGAVTNCLMPAFLIPDSLAVAVGGPGTNSSSRIYWLGSRTTNGSLLLTANPGSASIGGSASTPNAFAAAGFFQSIAGQSGSTSAITASPTTFLSAGSLSGVTANYGYSAGTGNNNGFFQMQPILVGVGGSGTGNGGIGCGAGGAGGVGGAGMVVIISW